MDTQTDSTLIAVRNEKGQLIGVMERLNKGFEVYVTKEASVKEVEMLFTTNLVKNSFTRKEGNQMIAKGENSAIFIDMIQKY